MGRIAKKIASCLFTTQKTMRVIEKGKVKKNCSLQNFKWYATSSGLIQVSSFRMWMRNILSILTHENEIVIAKGN